jgi:hypothetical protein
MIPVVGPTRMSFGMSGSDVGTPSNRSSANSIQDRSSSSSFGGAITNPLGAGGGGNYGNTTDKGLVSRQQAILKMQDDMLVGIRLESYPNIHQLDFLSDFP